MNFSSTLCITKVLALKFLFLHVFSMDLFKYFKPVSKSSLPSPNGKLPYCSIQFQLRVYSCSKQGSVKIATISVTQLESYISCMEQVLLYMTLQKRISQIEMAKCTWKQLCDNGHLLIILRPTLRKNKGSVAGLASYRQRQKRLLIKTFWSTKISRFMIFGRFNHYVTAGRQ